MIKVGINGFGRIGRCTARHILESRSDMQLVKINASGTPEQNKHLFMYDSIHGRSSVEIPESVVWSAERNIDALDWRGVDVVLECTGAFNDGKIARTHLDKGAGKVLISAPAKNVSNTIVYGVNHKNITADDSVISNASCTTNCLAPVVDAIDRAVGINRGFVTTIHSYTGDQPTADRRHKDPYRARAAAVSMVPTSTGAAKAIGLVLPHLQGKLHGSAIRVPTANVSCIDATFIVSRDTSVEEINSVMYSAHKSNPAILGYETAPLVSIDYNHTSESAIFAPEQTQVDNNTVRILAWYDNEWGYSCRMADVASELAKY